jgi:hypothetical protein
MEVSGKSRPRILPELRAASDALWSRFENTTVIRWCQWVGAFLSAQKVPEV